MPADTLDHHEVVLEVIAASLEDALAAEQGGAHRIELISRFDLGGLTPDFDLVHRVVDAIAIPVRVMLRERESFEVRDEAARNRLCAKATELAAMGAEGIVCGFLHKGGIDRSLLSSIVNSAPNLRFTFHRAFEEIRDPKSGVLELKSIAQVDRILTNGTGPTLEERLEYLRAFDTAARPEITIVAGGGMDAERIELIRRLSGIREFHVGRAVRSPATVDGAVDPSLVRGLLARFLPSP